MRDFPTRTLLTRPTDRRHVAARPPTGCLKALLRVPVVVHNRGLGGIFGQRLLIIEHRGRRTGRHYQSAVEVVAHDDTPSWTVVAAWGGRPQWLANIEANAATAVAVAGHRYEHPTQRQLNPDAAYDVLAAYACRHPFAARAVFRALAWPDPRTSGALRHVSETTSLITFAANETTAAAVESSP